MTSRPSPALSIALITALGVVLAWLGVAPGVDSIVFYVFDIVDQIPWDPIELLKPIYNPPPMYTHAYRPLSTFFVKAGAELFGRDLLSLERFTFAHGLFLVPYGLAARRFLLAHGFSARVALLGALAAQLSPTVLFSAWTIPEFDMVGGIWVLMGGALLREQRLRLAIPFLVLAVLTKETTAVLMFAYLLGAAATDFFSRSGPWSSRLGAFKVAASYLAFFALVVSPILFRKPPVTHVYGIGNEGFEWVRVAWIAFHDLSQVFYVLGFAGVVLLVALAAQRRPLPAWALGALALLPFAAPVLRFYNHYESIIFSDWISVLVAMVTALGAFGIVAARGEKDERTMAFTLIFGVLGLLAGPVLASFSRADLSARLYAPLLPMLYGLVWRGGEVVWCTLRGASDGGLALAPGAAGRVIRTALAIALVGFAWFPVAGAFNAVSFNAARFAVEQPAKLELLATLTPRPDPTGRPPPCPIVLYTNRDQELAQEELALWGGIPRDIATCTRLIQLSTTALGPGSIWTTPLKLRGYDQFREPYDDGALEKRIRTRKVMTTPLILYMQGARTAMTPDESLALDKDFTWAVKKMPETDVGYFEQAVGVIYTTDTPLERLFEEIAPRRKRHAAAFFQLPLWFHELPRRLLEGAPALESYRYVATSYAIAAGERPLGEAEVDWEGRDYRPVRLHGAPPPPSGPPPEPR
jgi:hypothetical protein